MCDNAQDWSYSAFGGKWQRDNPHSGRVASLFDPAGGQVMEQGLPTEADPVPETAEEAEESAEPLVDEPEEAEESAEPQMEEPKEEATEPALPETTESEEPEQGVNSGTDKKPAGGMLELPVMSDDSAESSKPESDAGLLPPLEPPPQ
jgi:hypothetical protein